MYKSIIFLFLSFSFVFSAQNLNDDLDNDLVPNKLDKCPNTPEGVFVKRDGCTKPIHKTIYFHHASAVVSNEFIQIMKNTAELITETPGYNISISGHTDSISDAKSNMKLSKKRAMVVQKLLVDNNISRDKIKLFWYGETMPVATNITHEGRTKNRRVNIVLD